MSSSIDPEVPTPPLTHPSLDEIDEQASPCRQESRVGNRVHMDRRKTPFRQYAPQAARRHILARELRIEHGDTHARYRQRTAEANAVHLEARRDHHVDLLVPAMKRSRRLPLV